MIVGVPREKAAGESARPSSGRFHQPWAAGQEYVGPSHHLRLDARLSSGRNDLLASDQTEALARLSRLLKHPRLELVQPFQIAQFCFEDRPTILFQSDFGEVFDAVRFLIITQREFQGFVPST